MRIRKDTGKCRILHTLRRALVGQKDTTPGIHDAFTERNDVVKRLEGDISTSGDS